MIATTAAVFALLCAVYFRLRPSPRHKAWSGLALILALGLTIGSILQPSKPDAKEYQQSLHAEAMEMCELISAAASNNKDAKILLLYSCSSVAAPVADFPQRCKNLLSPEMSQRLEFQEVPYFDQSSQSLKPSGSGFNVESPRDLSGCNLTEELYLQILAKHPQTGVVISLLTDNPELPLSQNLPEHVKSQYFANRQAVQQGLPPSSSADDDKVRSVFFTFDRSRPENSGLRLLPNP